MKQVHAFRDDKDVDFVFMATTNRKDNIPDFLDMGNTSYQFVKRRHVVQLCKGLDVLHTHRRRMDILECVNIPILYEIHDCGYENMRPKERQNEMEMLMMSDSVMCVSPGMVEYIDRTYPSINIKDKSFVIYSYPSLSVMPDINANIPPVFGRCVYQGGIVDKYTEGSSYNHRYYRPLFRKLCFQGIDVDIYPNDHKRHLRYNGEHMRIMDTLTDASHLYRKMTSYDFGFIGYFRTKSEVMDLAMPNKLFEYIACGIPILSMRYRDISDFIERTGTGVIVDDDMSLPIDFNERMAKAKKRCIEQCKDYNMESQKDIIKDVYRRLANGS